MQLIANQSNMSFSLNTLSSLNQRNNNYQQQQTPMRSTSTFSTPAPMQRTQTTTMQTPMLQKQSSFNTPASTTNVTSPSASSSAYRSPLTTNSPRFAWPSDSPTQTATTKLQQAQFNGGSLRNLHQASSGVGTTSTTHNRTVSTTGASSSGSVSSSSTTPANAPRGLRPTKRFNDPLVDSITGQLHIVRQWKTLPIFILSLSFFSVGVVLLALILFTPMSSRVRILNGTLSIPKNLVQTTGMALGLVCVYIGAVGLARYTGLRSPVREMEQVSERKKRLMGWNASQQQSGEGSGSGSSLQQQYEENRERESALLRRRAQASVASTAPSTIPIPSASSVSPQSTSSRTTHALSPIPTASLRFLDPSRIIGSGFGSPFRASSGGSSTGLASPLKTRAIQDEQALQGYVADVAKRESWNGGSLSLMNHLQQSPSSPNAAMSMSPYSSPIRNGQANGAMNATHASGLSTPPYVTSSRSQQQASASVMAVSSSIAAAQQQTTFSVPGLRYTLDDPRADGDLHDVFHSQLALLRPRRTTTQEFDTSVRRVKAWMVSVILRPVLRSYELSLASMANLARIVLAQQGVASAFNAEEMAQLKELAAVHILPSQLLSPTERVEEAILLLRTRFTARPETVQRSAIEPFLHIAHDPASSSSMVTSPTRTTPKIKAYLIRRIQQLCAPGDDSLAKYSVGVSGAGIAGTNTNSAQTLGGSTAGMKSTGSGWFGSTGGFGLSGSSSLKQGGGVGTQSAIGSTIFPSDSQILLHLFCAHMEIVLPGFTLQYVRDASGPSGTTVSPATLPRPTDASACIVQVRSGNLVPYYIVARAPNSSSSSLSGSNTRSSSSSSSQQNNSAVKYVTEPGRPSLFQCITLWMNELPVGSRLGREFTGLELTD